MKMQLRLDIVRWLLAAPDAWLDPSIKSIGATRARRSLQYLAGRAHELTLLEARYLSRRAGVSLGDLFEPCGRLVPLLDTSPQRGQRFDRARPLYSASNHRQQLERRRAFRAALSRHRQGRTP